MTRRVPSSARYLSSSPTHRVTAAILSLKTRGAFRILTTAQCQVWYRLCPEHALNAHLPEAYLIRSSHSFQLIIPHFRLTLDMGSEGEPGNMNATTLLRGSRQVKCTVKSL